MEKSNIPRSRQSDSTSGGKMTSEIFYPKLKSESPRLHSSQKYRLPAYDPRFRKVHNREVFNMELLPENRKLTRKLYSDAKESTSLTSSTPSLIENQNSLDLEESISRPIHSEFIENIDLEESLETPTMNFCSDSFCQTENPVVKLCHTSSQTDDLTSIKLNNKEQKSFEQMKKIETLLRTEQQSSELFLKDLKKSLLKENVSESFPPHKQNPFLQNLKPLPTLPTAEYLNKKNTKITEKQWTLMEIAKFIMNFVIWLAAFGVATTVLLILLSPLLLILYEYLDAVLYPKPKMEPSLINSGIQWCFDALDTAADIVTNLLFRERKCVVTLLSNENGCT